MAVFKNTCVTHRDQHNPSGNLAEQEIWIRLESPDATFNLIFLPLLKSLDLKAYPIADFPFPIYSSFVS